LCYLKIKDNKASLIKTYFLSPKFGVHYNLTELGSEKLIESLLNSQGWKVIDGPEYDNFSPTGKINGR
jgi:hypothetical protein